MNGKEVLVYGAYGYTGRLIVDECLRHGIKPIIAGRNADKIEAFAKAKDLEFEVLDVGEEDKLINWLSKGTVLIHCGGPFIHTARPMIEGCIKANTHYLDITGEYQVFDLARTYDEKAKEAGLMILPGAGFDVVPSDCLAAKLKEEMPDATHLQIAFVSKGGRLSRGTAKTMIENLGDPQKVRKNDEYADQPMGRSSRMVDFGEFEQLTLGISWGDISTAHTSTGIPNIEVFTGTNSGQLKKIRRFSRLAFLMRSRWMKNWLQKKLDKRPDGPSDEKREAAVMYLWGEVSNGQESKSARLTTPNGYTLTALTSVEIAKRVLKQDFKPGFQTPATAYGKDLITGIEGCRWTQ